MGEKTGLSGSRPYGGTEDHDRLTRVEADLAGEVDDLRAQNEALISARSVRETEVTHLQRTIRTLEAALEGDAKALEQLPLDTHRPADPSSSRTPQAHDLAAALADTTRHARALQQHIDNIESSRGWRLFSIYRRVKDSMSGRVGAGPNTSI